MQVVASRPSRPHGHPIYDDWLLAPRVASGGTSLSPHMLSSSILSDVGRIPRRVSHVKAANVTTSLSPTTPDRSTCPRM
jgi:hypothetical protein